MWQTKANGNDTIRLPTWINRNVSFPLCFAFHLRLCAYSYACLFLPFDHARVISCENGALTGTKKAVDKSPRILKGGYCQQPLFLILQFCEKQFYSLTNGLKAQSPNSSNISRRDQLLVLFLSILKLLYPSFRAFACAPRRMGVRHAYTAYCKNLTCSHLLFALPIDVRMHVTNRYSVRQMQPNYRQALSA